jgi:tRNA modification GTPase
MDNNKTLDEVLISILKDLIRILAKIRLKFRVTVLHIQQQIIQLLLRKGCRMADAGEFTHVLLNGKLDLSQAEAVADLISSDNEASHQIAMQQMRGGFSNEIAKLREELLNFASLIELELDLPKKMLNLLIELNFTNC